MISWHSLQLHFFKRGGHAGQARIPKQTPTTLVEISAISKEGEVQGDNSPDPHGWGAELPKAEEHWRIAAGILEYILGNVF